MGFVRCECGAVREAAHPTCPGCGRCPNCGRPRVTADELAAACSGCGAICCDGCGRCHWCGTARFAGVGSCSCGFPTAELAEGVRRSGGPARPRGSGCLGVIVAVVGGVGLAIALG